MEKSKLKSSRFPDLAASAGNRLRAIPEAQAHRDEKSLPFLGSGIPYLLPNF
jgi:hypothetical protein